MTPHWPHVNYIPQVVATEEEARRVAAATGKRVRFTEPVPGGFVQPVPAVMVTRNNDTPASREPNEHR